MVRIRNQKEFLAGVLFAIVGMVWAARATTLQLGTATAMGPGYFPLVVSVVLACTGLLSIVRSLRIPQEHSRESWNLLEMASILAGLLVFALLIERLGLVVASLALVLLSNPRRLIQKPLEVILLAVAIAAFVAVLFVYILSLPLPLF